LTTRVQFLAGLRDVSPVLSSLALRPIQPCVQWELDPLALAIKQMGHEADHSASVEVKNKDKWSYASPPCVFMLNKYQEEPYLLTCC
jgi:hypothetical protein